MLRVSREHTSISKLWAIQFSVLSYSLHEISKLEAKTFGSVHKASVKSGTRVTGTRARVDESSRLIRYLQMNRQFPPGMVLHAAERKVQYINFSFSVLRMTDKM